jgi:hypothetical protein
LDLVLDGKALWRAAKDYRRVGDHQARAIRLKDAGRRQNPAIAGDFPTIHLPATTGRKEMINELDRLMTITDLSEMLGVPVTPFTGGGTAVRARLATESVVMLDTAGQPSMLGLTPKPTRA